MKKWLSPLISAWVGVATHKLRSFLTIMGIVIGVAAVIVLMSIGKGAEANIISNIETLGSDLIMVQPGFTQSAGVRGGFGSATTLTLEDAQAVSDEVPNINMVAPSFSRSLQLVAGAQNMNAQVTGVSPEYMDVFRLSLADGSFISDYDYQSSAKVAVLGATTKETLFPDSDAVGQTLRVGGTIVRVIGVLDSKERLMMVASTDNSILVPLPTLQQAVGQPRTTRGERVINSISLTVTDEKLASQVTADITELLRERHQLAPEAESDFRVVSMEEIASTVSEAIGTMTLLLGAIAAISLLVGGIGVMNIMLVSVLERTREIGILKALGARERDIWGQFLIEAAFLAFSGGIIGIIIGGAISWVVERLGLMTTVVSADIIILAVSVSVGIGLFFGFYPAWNASRLNPIEALRSE